VSLNGGSSVSYVNLCAMGPKDHISGLFEMFELEAGLAAKVTLDYAKTVGEVHSEAIRHRVEERARSTLLILGRHWPL
jgi:hypothetical protein